MLIGYLVGVLGLLLIRSELFLPREWFGVVTLVIGGLLGWSLVWFDRLPIFIFFILKLRYLNMCSIK